MPAIRPSKRQMRWRPRVCHCDLLPEAHTVRTKRSWRIHQLRQGKVQAGALDAKPFSGSCSGNANQISSSSEYSGVGLDSDLGRSLTDRELYSEQSTSTPSAGEITASSHCTSRQSANAYPGSIQYDSTNNYLSSLQSSEFDSDEHSNHSLGSSATNKDSLLDLDELAKYDSEIDFQLSLSKETSFWEEVVSYIGNPDDWTDSEDSNTGDSLEIGAMKEGLIDEDFLDDETVELFDESSGLEEEVHNTTFTYDSDTEPWSEEELLSLLLYDIKQTHTVTRAAHDRYTNLIRQFSPLTPFCLATTFQRLQRVTGIEHQRYDCCSNSCMAFTESNIDHCLICLAPRYDKGGNPVKTFDFIPLTHRLRLQYSSATRARVFTSYPAKCRSQFELTGVITDIWNGKLLSQLQDKGLFLNNTDLCLSFHTDGVKLFKTRNPFHVWPLILIVNNLPPEERFKKENVLLLGVIPGPSQPKDIDSFLRPLINELKVLQAGIPGVYNAATKEYFRLHAYVCTIGADTKGREQLMGVSTSAYSYCFYCKTRGLYSSGKGSRGHVYCPFTKPADARTRPSTAHPSQRQRFDNNSLFVNVDPRNLELRSDHGFRTDAWQAFNSYPRKASNGISRLPIWCELESVIFPWAFVLDEMHLFWENVFILLFNHWRGRFFSRKDSTAKKFEQTQDIYNIDPSFWEQIGIGMQESRPDFPTAWGDSLRHFTKHCHEFKAAEWKNFWMLVAPVVLNDERVLAPDCYEAFCDLIEAVESATSDIPRDDIEDTIRTPLINFLHHYEAVYYQYCWERLETCRSQIHLLSHVADFVEWCGPMNLYAQWSCERFCGIISQSVRNRVQANRACSLDILRQQQAYHIPFMARKPRTLPDFPHSPDFCHETNYLEDIISNMVDIRQHGASRQIQQPAIIGEIDPPPGTPGNMFLAPLALYGPKSYKIKTYIRAYIFQFLKESGLQVSRRSIPSTITAYRTAKVQDESLISSEKLKPPNSTRSRSHAEYLWRNHQDAQGEPKVYYGKVLLFMSFRIMDSRHPEIYLALVQDFHCENEGRLKKIVRIERQDIICARDVLGMVAVIKNGINKASYVVKQRTALIG